MENFNIQFPLGFSAWGVRAGIKECDSLDLGLLVMEPCARVFGAFTRNRFCAAPVKHGRRIVALERPVSHLLVNSGNANACTGRQGMRDVQSSINELKRVFKPKGEILVASTGIIGKCLPLDKMIAGINELARKKSRKSGVESFAKALLTTDTRTKTARDEFDIGGKVVRIGGVAKGSGMIAPNMATMLGFLSTDIALPREYSSVFKSMVERSFNSVSVDGDMSTNDTVLLFANGASGLSYSKFSAQQRKLFDSNLLLQFQSLAKQIAADGEGATKLIQIRVLGAKSEKQARMLGRVVADSPLVKTAFFGEDPNWGRVVAALGSTPSSFNPNRVSVRFCGIPVFQKGQSVPFDNAKLIKEMSRKTVAMEIDLSCGTSEWVVWTCDLTYGYVKINAEYHT